MVSPQRFWSMLCSEENKQSSSEGTEKNPNVLQMPKIWWSQWGELETNNNWSWMSSAFKYKSSKNIGAANLARPTEMELFEERMRRKKFIVFNNTVFWPRVFKPVWRFRKQRNFKRFLQAVWIFFWRNSNFIRFNAKVKRGIHNQSTSAQRAPPRKKCWITN